MKNKPLLFYDSGAGGLPYLAAVRARLPGLRCVYLADRENFPLGEKAEEEVRRLVLYSISLAVRRFDPALVVLACNTASVVALQALRDRFPVPFVGVVPAVKPAALSPVDGKLAVVATRQTVSGPYLEGLIREFADGREVIRVPVAGLVEFAEYDYISAGAVQRRSAVFRELEPLLAEEVGAVVLGCTHFVLLEEEFRSALPEGVKLIDSREGVANRIVSLLSGDGALRGPGRASRSCRAELYLKGGAGEQERYRAFARHFGLRFCGSLEAR